MGKFLKLIELIGLLIEHKVDIKKELKVLYLEKLFKDKENKKCVVYEGHVNSKGKFEVQETFETGYFTFETTYSDELYIPIINKKLPIKDITKLFTGKVGDNKILLNFKDGNDYLFEFLN